MDISAWLRQLGMERYEQAFRENEVGLDVLPKLTAEDLKEIGVIPVGDRRRLLEAIAVLCGESELAPPQAARDVLESLPKSAGAERRQLTVMFVDLVGSTALAGRLDPEDMGQVLRAYQERCAEVVRRWDGHVAKYMGDGVLAYFGWPQAHEDEAVRAVWAGLALVEAVGGMSAPTGEPLSARVGIATGLVVVGDLIGEGASQEQAVVGDTPNLAARLQGIAAPSHVVIADATRRLLGASFDLKSLGARALKGIREPTRAFAVIRARPVESRFEAMSGPAVLPLVGRDQELALLLERWALAKAGEGQGVLLLGEAGIGKSRISRALLDAVADEPHTRIRYQCSPYHTDSALWPVTQQLSHAAGFGGDDDPDARLDKLEALLDQAGGRNAAPLIADLLGLDARARYGKLNLTPQAQRSRTLDALVGQLLGLAARQPVLMVLEDAHWLDPTTLELIEQCLDSIAAARVLILLTSRPHNQPALAAHPHVTRLTLNRLGRAGVEAIVARLGGDHLPTGTIDAIIARTDGVPLFVEELTKAVLETGETSIPASLNDSLMARLDRIPEVKAVAQVAACIGREFSHALLAAVSDSSGADLVTALDRLAAAELIFRRDTPPEARYIFKHALVRDAAYQSLLKVRRQQIHAALFEELRRRGDVAPEVLASHAEAAGLAETAVRHWFEAGQRAAERFANQEAIAHLERSLDGLRSQPEKAERDRQELEALLVLGAALATARGYGVPEVGAAYARAEQLCARVSDTTHLPEILQALRVHHMVRPALKTAYRYGERILAIAREHRDDAWAMEGHLGVGIPLCHMGEFEPAAKHLEQAIALGNGLPARPLVGRPIGDPLVVAFAYSGTVAWMRGFPDQASQRHNQAIERAEFLVIRSVSDRRSASL